MNRREDGTITVMLVGFFIVVGLLAVVVINASAAFLQRQELNNAADGAALAAADALGQEGLYRTGVGEDAPIDPRRAEAIVGEYLRATAPEIDHWRVSTDGDAVRVHLYRSMSLPLTPPGWFDSSRVTAEAAALLRISP